MKKIFLLAASLLTGLNFSPAIYADQGLAMKSGCMGCHKVEQKLVGPAFKDVAAKYAGQEGIVATLTQRVKGGTPGGNWGAIPMAPSNAAEADIQQVINWILTLK